MYFALFFVGLFFGSFLNVVADRLVNGKPLVFGRSECDNCKHQLAAKDLLPLVSFFKTGGRCAYCNIPLSYYYPLSEVLTGLAFALAAYLVDLRANLGAGTAWVGFGFLGVVFCVYIVLFLTDIKYRLLPNKITHPAIVFVFVFLLANVVFAAAMSRYDLATDDFGKYLLQAGLWNRRMDVLLRSFGLTLVSAFGLTAFFWVLTKIKNGQAMGGGDVKLALLIGLFNGFPLNMLAIFLGFLSGAVVSLGLIAVRRKTMRDTVPFGPFLILGSVVALVWGKELLEWYFRLFAFF